MENTTDRLPWSYGKTHRGTESKTAINKQWIDLPNGLYDALWSSNHMEILIPDKESVFIETIIGVKGIKCKQRVGIKDKLLSIVV